MQKLVEVLYSTKNKEGLYSSYKMINLQRAESGCKRRDQCRNLVEALCSTKSKEELYRNYKMINLEGTESGCQRRD